MLVSLAVQRCAFAGAVMTALGVAPLALAEDLSAEDEAAIMAKEDETEAALPLEKKPPGSLSGRVQLKGDAVAEADAVVGMLAVKDRAYLLRLGKPEVLAQLQRFNGKTATVFGKIRMQGKYFFAESVQAPVGAPPPMDRSRKSGM
jgi:hypothetical protein